MGDDCLASLRLPLGAVWLPNYKVIRQFFVASGSVNHRILSKTASRFIHYLTQTDRYITPSNNVYMRPCCYNLFRNALVTKLSPKLSKYRTSAQTLFNFTNFDKPLKRINFVVVLYAYLWLRLQTGGTRGSILTGRENDPFISIIVAYLLALWVHLGMHIFYLFEFLQYFNLTWTDLT